MRIALLGARGNIGRCVLSEAVNRGHNISVMLRNGVLSADISEHVDVVTGDAEDPEKVAQFASDHDVIISTLRPPAGQETLLVSMTQSVLSAAKETGVRAIITGGAARLEIPGLNGLTVLTAPGFLPASVRPIAEACQAQYEICEREEHAQWTYVSPPAEIGPGARTGAYRTEVDTMVQDKEGRSRISYEDFAVALVDEAEQCKHPNTAFTVGYQ